jgi:hypothetical protein
MDTVTLRKCLDLAERHYDEGVKVLERQRSLLESLRRHGHDTREAEELLKEFEETQALHTADRDRLRSQLNDAQRGP